MWLFLDNETKKIKCKIDKRWKKKNNIKSTKKNCVKFPLNCFLGYNPYKEVFWWKFKEISQSTRFWKWICKLLNNIKIKKIKLLSYLSCCQNLVRSSCGWFASVTTPQKWKETLNEMMIAWNLYTIHD
jgi:hypothetical protein